jgi:hypothetical protein
MYARSLPCGNQYGDQHGAALCVYVKTPSFKKKIMASPNLLSPSYNLSSSAGSSAGRHADSVCQKPSLSLPRYYIRNNIIRQSFLILKKYYYFLKAKAEFKDKIKSLIPEGWAIIKPADVFELILSPFSYDVIFLVLSL